MKNKISMMIIAIVAITLFACQTEKEKQYEDLLNFVKTAHMDSCQYNIADNIQYFFGDTMIETGHPFSTFVIVSGDTILLDESSVYNEEMLRRNIEKTLLSRWPNPEPFASVRLRSFTRLIENEKIDSCVIERGRKSTDYVFYLKTYKIEIQDGCYIPFKQFTGISIHTVDINGSLVCNFSDYTSIDRQGWTIDDKQKILKTLCDRSNQKK